MSETVTETPTSASGQGVDPGEPPAPATDAGDRQLGPQGEKALEEWKRRAKDAEKEAKAHAARLKEFEDRDKSDLEKATERASAAEQRMSELRDRAVRAEVKALASAQFADPSDASAFLDLSAYVTDDGDIDSTAIERDLADLLKTKPHLAKAAPPPSFDAGPRTTASTGTDMNALIRQAATGR
ncbi:hypothetical protein GCM10010406_21140 [Streptomyces thermolineatus]|uniref:Scaffolding protein n=1 Tax=Streptomyces thermolineatus TaxID=44033 RepID=A0ABN3LHX9_9ACTN